MVKRRLRSLLSPSKRALKIAIATTGAFALFIAADFFRLAGTLPAIDAEPSRRITDRYGKEVRHALSFQGERRYQTDLREVPDLVRDAFISAEDRNFYAHAGVDWRALGRGIIQSLRQRRFVSGGSTITMQLVRIEWPQIRGWIHKPAQILQSLRIERKHSKGEILTRYLNRVPFAHQIAGVGAACRTFFDRECNQLSPAQTAALAILPRNPAFFTKNPGALKQRRDALLARILAQTEPAVLAQALDEPIHFQRSAPEFSAPHLTDRVLAEVRDSAEIKLTIDLELQRRLQEELAGETRFRRGTGDTGAILVIENDTGNVLAYVGSPDFFDPSHGMVDGVQVLRSPGSALKPFIYQYAVENNWNLFDLLPDVPMVFSTARAIYEPNNYGGNFSGPRTLREALANSKNIPALYLTSQLGEARVLSHLREIGFSHFDHDADHYGVGLALGNAEVTLWELTQAYATLARGGVLIPSRYFATHDENIRPKRVMSAESAYLIADVLRDPIARQEEFGRFGPLEFDFDVGVKTGTSSDYRDHWTIGFTRALTVGVWRGNADATPLPHRVSASRGAGPLFHRAFEIAHSSRVPAWPDRPATLETSRVCALSGQIPGAHCPLSHNEWHRAGSKPKKICDFHREAVLPQCRFTYVKLPSEYDEWSRAAEFPSYENQLREHCAGIQLTHAAESPSNSPRIIEPLTQTVYAVDPTIPLPHQEIRFALRGKTDPKHELRLYVNDELYDEKISDQEVFWPLKRGKHRFYVKQGELKSNVVEILVR